ncbi:hypothetical protein JN25_02270 [Bacillus sp. BSC154]|nr:hypothetical protein JN25_02270 [Bacillus sp. BSC154]
MAVQIKKRVLLVNPLRLLRCCHASALISAGKAGLRTCLAMIMIMLFTFSAARFTNIGAKCANFFHERTVRLHGFDRQRANIRAFPVKPYAAAEIVMRAFFQAFCKTMIASLHTIDTSLNTSF